MTRASVGRAQALHEASATRQVPSPPPAPHYVVVWDGVKDRRGETFSLLGDGLQRRQSVLEP